jgi:hypothetical protein
MAKPKYIVANPAMYKILIDYLAHEDKWMNKLFSPFGLLMLFPSLRYLK